MFCFYRTHNIWKEYIMTNQIHRKTDARQRPPIPSREEFHRDFAGLIFAADFNTNHPNPYRNVAHTQSERSVLKTYHQQQHT